MKEKARKPIITYLFVLPLWLLGLFFLFPVGVTLAQTPPVEVRDDFTDKELKLFIKAEEKVTAIQMESQKKIAKVIEDEGLTVDRFNEILVMQQDPSKKVDTQAEELNSFNNAAQEIIKENQAVEQKLATSIEQEGLDLDTYREIMVAYQQNPKVQIRVNELINKKD